ncbi:hypothetical protein Taro_056990 [Colocasia esculenta]|uniref:Uncharacterized protein n=1 Tax=Colocasia esculenta TaxID=4460 RepID=A0A843XYC4_COLES|nr:hypothetical protein [Colocasia esculenta]
MPMNRFWSISRFYKVKDCIFDNFVSDLTFIKRGAQPGRTTFSCKGSVDTTMSGVDTMAQSKDRNMKKRSTSVATSPGQVDTRDRSQRNLLTGFYLRHGVDTESSQVDTRDLSQGIVLPVWDSVSTHLMGRSTHSGISVT